MTGAEGLPVLSGQVFIGRADGTGEWQPIGHALAADSMGFYGQDEPGPLLATSTNRSVTVTFALPRSAQRRRRLFRVMYGTANPRRLLGPPPLAVDGHAYRRRMQARRRRNGRRG